MAITFGDYKLRPSHCLLSVLITISVVLGFSYLNETSRSIQLQQRLLILERRLQSIAVDRSNLRRRTDNLQDQLEKQVNEMNKLQKIRDFETEQLSIKCVSEKDNLQETVLSKENIIKELTDQHENLKTQHETLRSEMKQVEKDQSRLLERFSTQSTQCMNVINMMREICDERRAKKSRGESKATDKAKATFIGFITGLPSLPAINQTNDKLHNTRDNPGVSLHTTINTRMDRITDTGDNRLISTTSQMETMVENDPSFKQEVQSFMRENEKTRLMGKKIIKEIRDQLYKNYNMQRKSEPGEEEETINIENKEAPKVENNFELDSKRENEEERSRDFTQNIKENKVELDGELEKEEEGRTRELVLAIKEEKTQITENSDAVDIENNGLDIEQEYQEEDTFLENKQMSGGKITQKKENSESPKIEYKNEWGNEQEGRTLGDTGKINKSEKAKIMQKDNESTKNQKGTNMSVLESNNLANVKYSDKKNKSTLSSDIRISDPELKENINQNVSKYEKDYYKNVDSQKLLLDRRNEKI
ncbi:Golgi membrane protein 1-like [Pelobates fuscus]|uniref:Golgi membrane protein 1-like n=1 Tax=Pelobates fuscus TaxID=191477 RepID=UPI002FE49307